MTFTPEIYEQIRAGAQRSAAVIVPLLIDTILPQTGRILDVGGGEGWFAREFAQRGYQADVVDESVEAPNFIEHDHEHGGGSVNFYPGDLVTHRHVPDVETSYDLALCLEVAEHLPADAADGLVAWLVARAPLVAFSAAIPGQGGHGHLHERWPGYWADLFAEHGYECSDSLRWQIWTDAQVEPWYRQNLFVFARTGILASHGLPVGRPLPVVHPDIFAWRLP